MEGATSQTRVADMHGIICKAIETFLIAQHGMCRWRVIVRSAEIGIETFETVHNYDDEVAKRLLTSASRHLDITRVTLLEDMGTWICTHPPLEPVRRLFRFSGATFEEMLFALDEVHERGRMALPDLDLPVLSLIELGEGHYRVASTWGVPGTSAVLIGVLRAMADDYGTLAYLEFERSAEVNGSWSEIISVRLLDERFSAPREFRLGGVA